jgi:hypothetical protein
VLEDAGIEPMTVATHPLHSARSHPFNLQPRASHHFLKI